jgi:hypothetical protein
MVLTYHTNAGKFVADPPRLWSDVQIADTGVLPNFDASLDGRHVVVLMPATLDTLRRTHVTFLIHFTDLLRERIPGPRR